MTDPDLVAKKLAAIETCVADLRRLARPAELRRDLREQRFVEHTLQIAIQAALDGSGGGGGRVEAPSWRPGRFRRRCQDADAHGELMRQGSVSSRARNSCATPTGGWRPVSPLPGFCGTKGVREGESATFSHCVPR